MSNLKKRENPSDGCCSGIKDELPATNREIMYGISKDYRSRGYTTQAVQGVIQYLFENTGLKN
ncbi:GNAT family N-acetyltransferase [Paenibacillus sp. SEL3]